MLKTLSVVLVMAPLVMARAGLSGDGEKYLAEAKTRIAKVEKTIAADAADAERARKATDDLLASKRFLDNVQKEQPKHRDAVVLQKKADTLLAKLEPALLEQAIEERLAHIDEVLTSLSKDLSVSKRSAKEEDALQARFEMLRTMVRQVLDKDPDNARALAAAKRENALWQKYRAQRAGVKDGGRR